MIEKDIENKLKKLLKEKNIWYLKTHGGSLQSAGVADLLICYNGLFVAIEVKKWPNKLTPLQKAHLLHQKQNGAVVIVLDQYNLTELLERIKNNENLIWVSKNSIRKYFDA